MKTYRFLVSLCGGWCNGYVKVEAENEESAFNKAMDLVVERLVKAFPELGIDYYVECHEDDYDEYED